MLDVWSRAPRVARRVAFLIGSVCVLLPTLASAQTTTVRAVWDPSPPSEQVSSYEVCIGTSSRSCNIRLANVSANQSSLVFAPPPGQMVYVAVRAVNSKGRSSYSTEQTFSIPSLNGLTNRSTAMSAAIGPINLSVSDPDGSPLTYTHTGLPMGVAINSKTGQITGTPTNAGTYNVTIFVSDGLTTVSRSFLWTVTSGTTLDRTPPLLTITSHTSGLVVTSASQTIRGTATDSGRGGSGITTVRVNGQSATGGAASGNNTASWSRTISLSSGSNSVTIEAVDSAGNIQMQQITLQLAVSGSSSTSGSGSGTTSGSTGGAGGGTSTSSGPFSITSLTSNRTSPQAPGTLITFTAAASGGRSPYQFKWLVYDGTTWNVVRNWSSSNTFTWSTPAREGAYRIGIWARDATMTADIGTYNLNVMFRSRGTASAPAPAPPPVTAPSAPVSSPTPISGPLVVAGLTSSVESPQAPGTSITFTALVTGGTGRYQIRWLFFDGTSWTVLRNWSPSTTYAWRPMTTTTGASRIGVEVLDATSPTSASPAGWSVPFRIKSGN